MDQVTGQNTQAPSKSHQTPQTPSAPPAANQIKPKPSQNYFARLYSGRVNRRNFIIGNLLPTITLILLNILLIFVGAHNPFAITHLQLTTGKTIANAQQVSPLSNILTIVSILMAIITTLYIIIYTSSLLIRILHDLNKSGWLWLLTFVPFISFLLGIYVTFFPGTAGGNNYGSIPLPRINLTQDILRLS